MKIVPIFAKEKTPKEGLFSIHFDDEGEDEVTKCIDNWLFNTQYLYDFFTLHKKDLNSGYYGKNISIHKAISFTRQEAESLFNELKKLAILATEENGNSLSLAFQPLKDGDYSKKELQQEKAKTSIQKKWLRLYAIRIAPNTFVITGGAIKLVATMNDRSHLIKELQKLNDVRTYLISEGILDQDDFETFEI
jgi:hypothetical protein